ncbi:transglutaminase family protein [Crossiella sp. NPDC003009]
MERDLGRTPVKPQPAAGSRDRAGERLTLAGVLLAGALAGLLFAPVFGLGVLLPPVLTVTLVLAAGAELLARTPALIPWRPLLLGAAGLLGIVESALFDTTLAGLPTGDTVRALGAGLVDSWRLTLESTWPARPEPELLLFVPLLVLAAGVLGIELAHRFRGPLPALLPSAVVLGLSQLYAAATGGFALAAALGYAAACALALVRGQVRPVALVVVAAAALAGSGVGLLADPLGRPAYSLQDERSTPLPPAPTVSPLTEIAARLREPDRAVFSYTSPAPVDRWPLAVFTEFDGVNWRTGGDFQRLGAELAPPPGLLDPQRREARISTPPGSGRWLPSQSWPAAVSGTDPLIGPASGMLFGPGGAVDYRLSWWEPKAEGLLEAPIDPDVPGWQGGIGEVPPGMAELAEQATRGLRATFQTALQLQRFFTDHYRLASGAELPTGHGWPQLERFLLHTKQGTSEQFAAAYVALARLRGIPARLAVGYAAPATSAADGRWVVRNRDVLAWPEVAVRGFGWVPLDPTETAARSTATGGLADLTARARQNLPAPEAMRNPELPAAGAGDEADEAGSGSWWWLLWALPALVLGLPVLWVLGVPLLRLLRRWRRRRATGTAAVAGAVAEVRDRLRAFGIPVTPGMTVRDLATAAGPGADRFTAESVRLLAGTVDAALWSGAQVTGELAERAWDAERQVRKSLSRNGSLRARLRAALDPRTG